MSWADELPKIRRFLRDPAGNIWSEALLKNLYNDVQKEVQIMTRVLEDYRVQRVPGLYHYSYMHDWESEHLPTAYSLFYQCLTQYDGMVICNRWEPHVRSMIDAAPDEYGTHFTQPWEAFMGITPADPVRMKWPPNLHRLKFIAYDEVPITEMSKKSIQSGDASYITRTGDPFCFYEHDDIDDSYSLYPRPSTGWVEELDGNEGPAWYISGDTEDVTSGTVAVRVGSTGSAGAGVPVDIADTTDNVFIVYDVDPTNISGSLDEGDYPEFLRKYIRYGVVSRAYGANTDGRIPSLSAYWAFRFEEGMKRIKRYIHNQAQDRDYQLMTNGVSRQRRFRHPRLPPEYPAI